MAQRLTPHAFIEKARRMHGEKYDYSKVKYVNVITKVTITCPDHGDFDQTPARHLHGRLGCKECAAVADSASIYAFIAKARAVHGGQYDYSLVEYADNHTAVTIVCPQHGSFQLLPNSHLGGKGCKLCTATRYANSKRHSQGFCAEP